MVKQVYNLVKEQSIIKLSYPNDDNNVRILKVYAIYIYYFSDITQFLNLCIDNENTNY